MKGLRLLIVGAEKSGTSSFHDLLASHPGINTHLEQEFTFFADREEYGLGLERALKCYKLKQPLEAGLPLVAKAAGIIHNQSMLERVAAHDPGLHLMVLLREPVDRALSAWKYQRRMGRDSCESFGTAFDRDIRSGNPADRDFPSTAYYRRGLYGLQLSRALALFPKSQVHVYVFEEVCEDPTPLLQESAALLGLDPSGFGRLRQSNPGREVRSATIARLLSSPSRVRRFVKALLGRRLSRNLKSMLRQMNESDSRPGDIAPAEGDSYRGAYKRDRHQLELLLDRTMPWP